MTIVLVRDRRRQAARQPLLHPLVIIAAVLLLVDAMPAPAHAQSFFESLFGWAKPKAKNAPALARTTGPAGTTVLGALPGFRGGPYFPGGQSQADHGQRRRSGGRYTTMCVRMCDGFYFPISASTSRQNFRRDAAACDDRCTNTQARLFYRPASSSDMHDAVDLTGRAYAKLPIAFLHRKTYVKGCTCRPAPWTAAERARHRQYAVAEGLADTGEPVAEATTANDIVAQLRTTTTDAVSSDNAAPAKKNFTAPTPAQEPVVGQQPVSAPAPTFVTGPDARRETAAGKPRNLRVRQDTTGANAAVPQRPGDVAPRRPQRPTRTQYSKAPASGVFGLFGTGQQQTSSRFTWPGDRPTSYR